MGSTASGKKRWGSLQRNALTALWNEFDDDNSQGFTYHFNELDMDTLDKLYNSSPVFTAADKGLFNRNVRNHAKKFATNLELEGARVKAKAANPPREFLFYSTQYYCISFYFFSHSFFKYYDMYRQQQQQQLQKKRETTTTTKKKKKNK